MSLIRPTTDMAINEGHYRPAIKGWLGIVNPALSARVTRLCVLAASAEASRTYDLCISVAGRRLLWCNPSHVVMPSDDCIAY